jgi:Ca2+-binding EF-hand superfamily protein
MNITSSLISRIYITISRKQNQRMTKQTATATMEGTRKGEDQANEVRTKFKRI